MTPNTPHFEYDVQDSWVETSSDTSMTTTVYPLTCVQDVDDFQSGATSMLDLYAQIIDDVFADYAQDWLELAEL